MKQVIDGYEITTASNEAAEKTKRGIESFIESVSYTHLTLPTTPYV